MGNLKNGVRGRDSAGEGGGWDSAGMEEFEKPLGGSLEGLEGRVDVGLVEKGQVEERLREGLASVDAARGSVTAQDNSVATPTATCRRRRTSGRACGVAMWETKPRRSVVEVGGGGSGAMAMRRMLAFSSAATGGIRLRAEAQG